MSKTAIVLFNLGGPDSLAAVEPFLYNLFKDPAIFRLPKFFRLPLAKFVSRRRAQKAKRIYEHMGGRSPIFEQTQEQAKALEDRLNSDAQNETYKVFICMRYWHPMSEHTVLQVKYWKADKIILLPLYPQFSTTTTASSLKDWEDRCRIDMLDIPTHAVCCYPNKEAFVKSHVALIKEQYEKAKVHGEPRILFSAHGLPEKVIKAGDPYQFQVEQTTASVIKELGIGSLDHVICYQSRVGPLTWIGPSTESEILRAAKDNVPTVVAPIAFVSEHSETLVELDIEYKDLFEINGGKNYFRVPALGVQAKYIEALADICRSVRSTSNFNKTIAPAGDKRICSCEFGACPCAK